METKLSKLIASAAAGDWENALRIAARFQELGFEKADVKRAHEAYTNPDFYRQLGFDPEELKAAGIEALKARYKLGDKIAQEEAPPIQSDAPKPAKKAGKKAEADDAASRGEMPSPPDFSAPTHKAWRKKLADVVALADAGDVAGLRDYPIEPKSSSRKMICTFQDRAIIALEARASR